MDPAPDDRLPWHARVATVLRASPAELLGLLVLLTGALLATGSLWWSALQRPEVELGPSATVGHEATVTGPSAGVDDGATHHEPSTDEPVSTVTVHVTGAVARPGVVTIPGPGRVTDAVAAAGGPAAGADVDRINLARPVVDGEHVHVPRIGEEPPVVWPSAGTGEDAGGSGGAGARIDLNRATAEQLRTLPGIGPAKAAAIVRHREEHGPFGAPGDVRAVPGIGEATFQGLADLVTVG